MAKDPPSQNQGAASRRFWRNVVLIALAHAALIAKYGWQMRLLDFGSWLGGRISRRAYLEISD